MQTGERLPRFRRQPDAVPAGFTLMPRDEEIILTVARHKFIRSYSIIDLLLAKHPGTSEDKILRRLRLLFDAGYLLRPLAQVETYKAGAGSRPHVYTLGNRGID